MKHLFIVLVTIMCGIAYSQSNTPKYEVTWCLGVKVSHPCPDAVNE